MTVPDPPAPRSHTAVSGAPGEQYGSEVRLPVLYAATVTHARRETISRTFRHRTYLWLVDLDALPDLPRWLRPFARFEARDHLGDPPTDSRPWWSRKVNR